MNSHSNPLMQRDGLPKFDQIKAEDFVPAVRAVFTKTENVLKDVEEHSEPTWDSLIKPFDETDLDWEYTWSVLNHLKSVKIPRNYAKLLTSLCQNASAFP